MLNHVARHVLSRGLEHVQKTMNAGESATTFNGISNSDGSPDVPGSDGNTFELSPWAIIMLSLTILSFILIENVISYTVTQVIATLTMVESPTADLYIPVESNDDPDAPLDKKESTEPDLLLVKTPLLTSRLSSILGYLRREGGVRSFFRGIFISVVHSFLVLRLADAFTLFLPATFFSRAIATIISSVILARFSMTWTHIVITRSSSKYWFQRMGSARDGKWKKIALPTAILATAKQLTVGLPLVLLSTYDLDEYLANPELLKDLSEGEIRTLVGGILLMIGLAGALALLIVVPALVTLTRVQASLLSDDEETIVPFDRSFGGKVEPAVTGGSGAIGLLDAWKTFDRSARFRLLSLYVRVGLMQTAVYALASLFILLEVSFFMGAELEKYFNQVTGPGAL
jgi:hypothetical protein